MLLTGSENPFLSFAAKFLASIILIRKKTFNSLMVKDEIDLKKFGDGLYILR